MSLISSAIMAFPRATSRSKFCPQALPIIKKSAIIFNPFIIALSMKAIHPGLDAFTNHTKAENNKNNTCSPDLVILTLLVLTGNREVALCLRSTIFFRIKLSIILVKLPCIQCTVT